MTIIRRCFKHVIEHEKIARIEYDINGLTDRLVVDDQRCILHNGKAMSCPWNFKDALSLVSTGHWVEIYPDARDVPLTGQGEAW